MSGPRNPAAFPAAAIGPSDDLSFQEGMLLRDWFAGQSIAPVARTVIDAGKGLAPEEDADCIAVISYMIADAMLTERPQSPWGCPYCGGFVMAYLANCTNCLFAKGECVRRDALRAGLKGLSVTSVKFICRDRKPMFAVGQRVSVMRPVSDPGNGDWGTDAITNESWPATVVAERDRRFQIIVDDVQSDHDTPARAYIKNESLYAKVRAWRLTPLDEQPREVCGACQVVRAPDGLIGNCFGYEDGEYSHYPAGCLKAPQVSSSPA